MKMTLVAPISNLLAFAQPLIKIEPPYFVKLHESTEETKAIAEFINLPQEFRIVCGTIEKEENPNNYSHHHHYHHQKTAEPTTVFATGHKLFAIELKDRNKPKVLTQERCSASVHSAYFSYCIMNPYYNQNTNRGYRDNPFRIEAVYLEKDRTYNSYGNKSEAFGSLRFIVQIIINEQIIPILCDFDHAEILFGIRLSPSNFNHITIDNDLKGSFDFLSHINKFINFYGDKYNKIMFNISLSHLSTILSTFHIQNGDNAKTLIKGLMNQKGGAKQYTPTLSKNAGISKCYNRVLPIAIQNWDNDPLSVLRFYSIAEEAHTTRNSVKMSSLFNGIYEKVKNVEDFVKIDREITDHLEKSEYANSNNYYYYNDRSYIRSSDPFRILENHPLYKESRKKAIAATGNRAYSKLLQEFDSLKIDEKSFPKTSNLIKSGKIPITTFFQKSEQYFLLNDNWPLWEAMLKSGHEDIIVEIAKKAAGRTTYEKDIMSYFYFVLYALPEYLKKHTGKKWTCLPKLVDSSTELEPPTSDDNGIRRSRSALTPIVDNENNTVTVPYASLAIGGGYGTTYCYSLTYSLLSRGFSFNGNTCINDVEEKLNGRDDYGLMFYTLTGSAQGRGYPTFLIIFERRLDKTHVHFHRTHPSRSKDGDYNPIHNWIRVCYNWMIGNVHKDTIKYQQGDLAFVSIDPDKIENINFSRQVEKYDNHTFSQMVDFADYEKKEKTNILGYVRLHSDTILQHHEHEHVPMKEGSYEVRICRSWEANPKGIWSLRID